MRKVSEPKTKEQKKPVWKRWWVWVLVILFLFSSCGNDNDRKEEVEVTPIVIEETVAPTEEIIVEDIIEILIIETTPSTEPKVIETTEPVQETESVQETEPGKTIIYVYTTPSGAKYHRANCRHIKNSDLTKWDINKVPSSYEPCGTCNP